MPNDPTPNRSWTYTNAQAKPGVALFIRIARRSYADQSQKPVSFLIAPPQRPLPLRRMVTSSWREPLPSARIEVSCDRLLVESPGFETMLTHGLGPKASSME